MLPVEKVLLSCELEFHVQVQKKVEKSMESLFSVLKDHRSPYVIELQVGDTSFQATISELADQLPIFSYRKK